jgi:MoxR-like ATPase
MLKINMDTPSRTDELKLAQRMLGGDAPEDILARGEVKQVISSEALTRLRKLLGGTLIKDDLIGYIVDIVQGTRKHQAVLVGAGPRATQSLLLASRAMAAIQGRDFVTPDDIKNMAVPVLEHRLILRPEFEIEGLSVLEVIEDILKDMVVPR